jgi:hypothetical protein
LFRSVETLRPAVVEHSEAAAHDGGVLGEGVRKTAARAKVFLIVLVTAFPKGPSLPAMTMPLPKFSSR